MLDPDDPRPAHHADPDGDRFDAVLIDHWFTQNDLHQLRHETTLVAGGLGLPASRVSAVALVISELVANMIEHGGGLGRLRMWTRPTELVCRISDNGSGIYSPPEPQMPADAPRGRGLWLALTFADSLVVDNPPDGGATVTATFDLPTAGCSDG